MTRDSRLPECYNNDMNYLILGGGGVEATERAGERQWVRDVADVVHPFADQVNFLDYRHWAAENKPIDLELEIAAAGRMAANYEDYAIVAKSIGVVATILAHDRGLIHPQRCFFFGFPLAVVDQYPKVDAAIAKLPPTVFVQNCRDPVGSFFEVRGYVEEHAPEQHVFAQTGGNTQDYSAAIVEQVVSRS
jgi:hypothetical protein